MLNVLCEILRALNEVKTTHLMIHPYHYLQLEITTNTKNHTILYTI